MHSRAINSSVERDSTPENIDLRADPATAANPGRALVIDVDGQTYARIPVRTHVVTENDDIVDVAEKYAGPLVRSGDILVVSEKVVAITQGRAVPVEQIRVGALAKLLWPRVRQVKYGIGLRSPYSMQCAIDECGHVRILLAAIVGAIGKLLGRKGDFYRVAGIQAAMIDAAGTAGIDAFKGSVIKGPKDPNGVAQRLARRLRCAAAVVDVNDVGGSWAVGASRGLDRRLVEKAMRDNPLGQSAEQTPMGLIRRLET
jgi:F420-0:gamma-glutamyl ligase